MYRHCYCKVFLQIKIIEIEIFLPLYWARLAVELNLWCEPGGAATMRYGISAWFRNLTAQSQAKITRLIQTAMKMMGVRQHPSPQTTFQQTIFKVQYVTYYIC